MKIELLQENLNQGLSWVGRFVANKPSLPILGMVEITAEKGKVKIRGTDMDTGIEAVVGARVEEEGRVVVPARLLAEYVNLLPAGKVKLENKEEELLIAGGKSKAKLRGMKADEYPEMPKVIGERKVKIKRQVLEQVVKWVGFAASNEAARPVLSALMIEVSKKGQMKVVATDGYRLSLLGGIKVEELEEAVKLLVPARVMVEVDRLAKDIGVEEVVLEIAEKARSIVFELGPIKVVSRLVDGEFPNYQRILPTEKQVTISMDVKVMLEAVKIAAIVARDGSNIVKWLVDEEGIKVVAAAANVGEQESVVEVVKEGEMKETIAFNSRFLLDWLSTVPGKEVVFETNGALQPGLFRSKEADLIHVIMPVRTQD